MFVHTSLIVLGLTFTSHITKHLAIVSAYLDNNKMVFVFMDI